MTDPYADPQDHSTEPDLVAQGEVRSQREQLLARLRDLGATPDELQAVDEGWDQLDTDDDPDPLAWTKARREYLTKGAPDAELQGLLQAVRDEYDVGTVTEDEAADRDRAAALDAALAEAAGRIGGNVQSVMSWVADDQVRAEAVLRLELAPEGAKRTTLVGPLSDQLGPEAVAAIGASYTEAPGGADSPAGPDAAAEAPEAQEGAQGGASGDAADAAAPWSYDLDVDPDISADELHLPPDALPDAQVGDRVAVLGPDDGTGNIMGAPAYVAEFDPQDGHAVLRWVEASGDLTDPEAKVVDPPEGT